jgi:hypothetical protein
LGSWSGFAVDYNILVTTDGNHQIDYNFTDLAGNSNTGTIYAARSAGVVTVTPVNPGSGWKSADFNVDFIVDFGLAGFGSAQYRLDGGGYGGFASDYNAPIATDGNHRIDYNFCNASFACTAGTLYALLDKTAPAAFSTPALRPTIRRISTSPSLT